MQNQLPSLITSNVQTGLALAGRLADQLHAQIEKASDKIELPGGMNYLLPAPIAKEVTVSIIFYAIAAANGGWVAKE